MEKFKERKIIKLLKKSPEDGIKMAIDIYGAAVNTICKNILINLNSEDIEEAISDTFFKLWKNVDNFKEPDRSIFILRYFYFEKVKEIASKLNLSEKKVENILYPSKTKLKEKLIKGGIIYEKD